MIAMDLRTDMYRCVQETMTLRFPPRYFVHLGQPDDHGPNSWSAIKPTMASLIGQESDDHVLNERLVNYTTNMAYFIGLTSKTRVTYTSHGQTPMAKTTGHKMLLFLF